MRKNNANFWRKKVCAGQILRRARTGGNMQARHALKWARRATNHNVFLISYSALSAHNAVTARSVT